MVWVRAMAGRRAAWTGSSNQAVRRRPGADGPPPVPVPQRSRPPRSLRSRASEHGISSLPSYNASAALTGYSSKLTGSVPAGRRAGARAVTYRRCSCVMPVSAIRPEHESGGTEFRFSGGAPRAGKALVWLITAFHGVRPWLIACRPCLAAGCSCAWLCWSRWCCGSLTCAVLANGQPPKAVAVTG